MRQNRPVREDMKPRADLSAPVHGDDLDLVREILAGSVPAWHTFIGRYSRLMMAVIRRYFPAHRRDEALALHAEVLESLYRGQLARYGGRCALSTWLVPVTRAAVVDRIRRHLGGRDLRDRLRSLGPFERDVFRSYYLEGMSFGEVVRTIRDGGALATPDRVLLALRTIEERVDDRLAQRLRYDLHAQSVGAASGRLLEYLDHLRGEAERNAALDDPEYRLLERETRRTLDEVNAIVAGLPEHERRLLSLRFERGWTANRIAQELGLGGQRSVYTMVDAILRHIRRGVSGRTEP
jgi:DNA-directed RNA polymerase specialized sigma24 family protein